MTPYIHDLQTRINVKAKSWECRDTLQAHELADEAALWREAERARDRLLAQIRDRQEQRGKVDRRADVAEHENGRPIEQERKGISWLKQSTAAAGYHENTPFDDVWTAALDALLGHAEEWPVATTPPETGDIAIGLACLRGLDLHTAHPMIVQWHEPLGWEQVKYTGQTPPPIAVIAWRPRPEFELARLRFLHASNQREGGGAVTTSDPRRPMSEPTCKGSILLLTAYQRCSLCQDEREMLCARLANGDVAKREARQGTRPQRRLSANRA